MADVVTMPKLGFDMAEGVLVRWVVPEGEQVGKGELLAEIETDKATVEVESPYTGIVFKHIVKENAIVPVNDPIAIVANEGEAVDVEALLGPAESSEQTPQVDGAVDAGTETAVAPVPAEMAAPGTILPDGVRASPLARKMARDQKIDLTKVVGSGPKGRIVKRDIERYLAQGPAKVTAPIISPPAFASATAEDTTVPLTKLRQAISRRMTESKQHFPHFYVSYEYDVDALMALRKEGNAALEGSGVKLSVNDFVIKAAALALREYPNLNASLGNGEIIRHGQINIGVAVAVDAGLLTVVCKNAGMKNLSQIAVEVKEMALRARDGRVRPDDVSGSTFTTSNLGMYGVDDFIAIINPPEAAILAIGGAKQVPVVKDGALTVGWRMRATISADHRVTDGAEAAQFMQSLAKYLESPLRLML